jgi:hypothetical protein
MHTGLSRRQSVLIALAATATIILLTGFLIRDQLLNQVLRDRAKRITEETGAIISWSDAGFSGISSVNIKKLAICPPKGDTLLTAGQIQIGVNPWSLLSLNLRFTDIEVNDPHLNFFRDGDNSNYLFLLRSSEGKPAVTDSTSGRTGFSELTDRIFRLLFRSIPENLRIRGFTASANINRHFVTFIVSDLNIEDRGFQTSVYVMEDTVANVWRLSGIIDPRNRRAGVCLASSGLRPVDIPYLEYRLGLRMAFDSLRMEFTYSPSVSGIAGISGSIRTSDFRIKHEKISAGDVLLRKAGADFRLKLGKTFAEIDSTTNLSWNEQSFHLFVRYDNSESEKICVKINEPALDAAVFFAALPDGLFTNLSGIGVRGNLAFRLNFDLDTSVPDSLVFDAALTSGNFGIERFGATDFRRIGDEFAYTAYEKGMPVRTFMVGPENPEFRRLEQIPDYLKFAILTSEDGAFFHHNGFIPDAIRESIITNIKEKRFARGGSTISMQLAKNVFLNRNKNITRKLEEMLITWLIESQQLVSKERMFEVYLNIIETGPMVYGVNEAARFYFSKDVSKLTLAESIYLASIIPRPKAFRYSFGQNGELREHMKAYYELVSSKMLKKEWITQEDYDRLVPNIELKGPARELVVVTDTIPAKAEEF